MQHSRLNTIILAILSCLLWSSAFAGIKVGLNYTTPLQFAGIRFFISGILVFPLAWWKNSGYFRIAGKNLRTVLMIAFLQTFLQYAFFYTGIAKVPGAIGAIVIGSGPLFIAIVAHFFMPGDTLNSRKTMIILTGIAGVALVSLGKDPTHLTGRIALSGILILVGNNIISGFTNVLIAREKGEIPPLVLSSASMCIGGAALFLFSLWTEGWSWDYKPVEYYLSLGWLSILSAVAISIWTALLKRPGIKVSDLNIWKFLIPVSGAGLSWLIIPGEKPEPLSLAGMIVIASSLIFLNLFQRKMRIRQLKGNIGANIKEKN